jgi:hypothetical protein
MEEPEAIEASYDLAVADLAKARLWLILRRRVVVLVGSFSILYGGWIVVRGLLGGSPLVDLLPYLVLLAYWVLWPTWAWLGARKFFRSLLPAQKHQRFRLTAEGFEQQDGTSFGRQTWETVLSAHETQDAFYFLTVGPMLRLLPKRGLASPTDAARVRDLLSNALGARARLRRD